MRSFTELLLYCLSSTWKSAERVSLKNWHVLFPITHQKNVLERQQDAGYIRQIVFTLVQLFSTLQQSTSPSQSIHLLSCSVLQDCSKLLVHSMPGQMVSRTVEACTTRLQHCFTNPPPISRWPAMPGSGATRGLRQHWCDSTALGRVLVQIYVSMGLVLFVNISASALLGFVF